MDKQTTKRKYPDSIYDCLAAAQAEWEQPKRDTQGQVGSQRYKYATIEQIIELIRNHLTVPFGISYSQTITQEHLHENVFMMNVVTYFHYPHAADAMGRSIREEFHMPVTARRGEGVPTPQDTGSAVTYARRYSLLALLGLGQEDDDGAAASRSASGKREKAPSVPFVRRASVGKGWSVSVPSAIAKQHATVKAKSPTGEEKEVVLDEKIGRAQNGVEEWRFTLPGDTGAA